MPGIERKRRGCFRHFLGTEQSLSRVGGRFSPAREDEPGKPVGKRRLADPLWPADEPGVMKPPRAPGINYFMLSMVVPDQVGIFAGMKSVGHRSRVTPRRVSTQSNIRVVTLSISLSASITAHRKGFFFAISRKPFLSRSWKAASIFS